MAEYREMEFEGEEVVADNNDFIGCTFRRCRITFSATGPCQFLGNTLDAHVDIVFTNGATDTVQFLRSLYRSTTGGRALVERTLEADIKGTALD